ncbi:MAG: PAS domain S-box protein, partial [Mesorhizobium sp.]
VRANGQSWPAGIALLGDEPLRALVVVVDDPAEDEVTPPASFGKREAPAAPERRIAAADNWEFVDRRAKRVKQAEPAGETVMPPDEVDQQETASDVLRSDAIDQSHARGPSLIAPSSSLLTGDDAPPAAANDSGPQTPQGEASEGGIESETIAVEADDEAQAEERPSSEPAPETGEAADAFTPDLKAAPVRFVWKTDAQGRFSELSPEFAAAVGGRAADVIDQPFRDVAARFGLDPDDEIAGLLERRDTWSGRSVMWPIEGSRFKAPVDLAALPVYGRDRHFEGFRGFGVVRMADAVADDDATGLDLGRDGSEPPAARHEPPAIRTLADKKPEEADAPDASDKVIRLAEHRASAPERVLSATESNAFREIGQRLREENAETAPEPVVVPGPETGEQPDDLAGVVETFDAPWDDEAEGFYAGGASDARDDADALFAEDIDFAPSQPAVAPGDDEEIIAATDAGIDADEDWDDDDALAQDEAIDNRSAAANDTSILAKLPIPLLIHSGDELHFANEEFFALTGYETLEELTQAGGLDALFAEPGDDEDFDPTDADDEVRDDGDNMRVLIARDGRSFRAEALLQSVPWGRGKALMLALKPATEAVAAAPSVEDAAEEVEARVSELQAILDTATDGIVIINNQGDIRSLSRPAEALFGFDGYELVGKPFVSLFAVESQRSARDYLSGLSDNGVASVLNDGREVIGRESRGRYIPLFMTIGRLPAGNGYCAVLRDITQWKRAEEELTQARAEAERSSGQKTEFLARISHEIRTPLNAIIGFSELMVDEKFGPILNDRYRDYLRDINRSGNHVLDLVNDLLDISKIEAGEQEMAHEAVSLNETLAEAVAMMQPQANRERVIIRSSFASRLPEVVADQRSVRQIALNLLSNAVRYTQAGGQVIVSTSYEMSGDVVMRFRDTGVGMSQAEIEQAMKPFKQINAIKRQRGDGTGLGLPLTKAMVEANRARFVINSAPSEGTMIEITFPSTRVLAG